MSIITDYPLQRYQNTLEQRRRAGKLTKGVWENLRNIQEEKVHVGKA
jgi:hypothetical protein